jgi:methoxymalonate biosynthesis acyl carrier protein
VSRTSSEEAAARLGSFVRSSLRVSDLTDDDDIFEKGDASSLFAMELVLFIEQELGIPLTDDDLEREDLSSIGDWTRLLEERLS